MLLKKLATKSICVFTLCFIGFECRAVEPAINRLFIIGLAMTIPLELYNRGIPSTYEIQNFSTGVVIALVAYHQTENPEINSILSVAVELVFLKSEIEYIKKFFLHDMNSPNSFNYWFLSGVGLIEVLAILRKLCWGET